MAGLRRGPEIEALNEPASVVSFFELPQRRLQLVYVFEMSDLEQLRFKGPEETLNTTIGPHRQLRRKQTLRHEVFT